jgi:hypothetical protein
MTEFLYLYRGSERVNAALSPQQMQDYMGRFQSWIASLTKAGKISSCGPLGNGSRTIIGSNAVVSDGPYAEAKDLVGGYTVLTAKDLEEATEIARGCPFLDVGGAVEVRTVLSVK